MDFFRITLKHGFRIASLPDRSLLNSGMRLFLASGARPPLLRYSAPVFGCMCRLQPATTMLAHASPLHPLHTALPLPAAPGCLTSLAGLVLTFSLSERGEPAPKRAASEAPLDASVSPLAWPCTLVAAAAACLYQEPAHAGEVPWLDVTFQPPGRLQASCCCNSTARVPPCPCSGAGALQRHQLLS